jgi:FkbM family methyltransferase
MHPDWPFPVPYPDGRWRLGNIRLLNLTDLWASIESIRHESVAVYAAYQGGDIIDVGAFHGWYTYLLAARTAGPVTFVSVEPDRDAIPDLRANLRAVQRRFPNIATVVIEEGVGDGHELQAVKPAAVSHQSYRSAPDGQLTGLTVDALAERHAISPRLVKIDVEGAEPFVLAGMRRTIAAHRPLIALELHPEWLPEGFRAQHLEDELLAANYRKTVVTDNGLTQMQLWHPM